VASLELARQGEVSLAQEQGFTPTTVQKGAGATPPAEQSTKRV
jgi:chromatin segregation and condensation protein Rec8/ScpA/Scc1 (kleisin family)